MSLCQTRSISLLFSYFSIFIHFLFFFYNPTPLLIDASTPVIRQFRTVLFLIVFILICKILLPSLINIILVSDKANIVTIVLLLHFYTFRLSFYNLTLLLSSSSTPMIRQFGTVLFLRFQFYIA